MATTTESLNEERGAFRKAWDRLTAGNIDDPTSEAARRYKNADGSLRDERKTDTELLEEMAPAPEMQEGPTEADVPIDPVATPEEEFTKAFDAPDVTDAPVANVVTPAKPKAPVKAKPAAVAPSAASQEPAPMADKVVDKVADKPKPVKKGFTYAGAQAAYDAANPAEVDEVEELDKPNTFGAKYSMPKSLAEQIRMIWQGKDYKPSDKMRVKARPVAASAADAIPK